MVSAPFAEFTWRHARRLAAEKGRDDTNETEVARVLDDLLTRAQAGPVDKLSDRITARTRVAAAAHRPPARDDDAGGHARPTAPDGRDGPLVDRDPVRGLRRRRRSRPVVMSRAADRGRADADIEHNVGADDPLTTKEGLAPLRRPPTPAAGAARRPRSWRGCRRASGPTTTRPAATTTPTCRW